MTRPLPLGSSPAWIDPAGNIYATGGRITAAEVTPGAAQTQPGGGWCLNGTRTILPCPDAFIVKADASGNKVFATLLGGPTRDNGSALAVDQSGSVYVIGSTEGSFPTTQNAAISVSTTSKTFAAKLSADGSTFVYSTYLPDIVGTLSAITVDAQGNAYVVGQTTTHHAYAIKLNADGSAFVYTKVLEGSDQESALAAVADAAGDLFVTGSTSSPDFPVSDGAVQSKLAGAQNAFVTKLDPTGNIVFSTFLGGSGKDQASAVQIDGDGKVYVAGTATSLDFPTTPGTFQPAPLVPAWSSSPGGFVGKLSQDGASIEYASYFWSIFQPRLALGASGDIFLAGGSHTGFPVTASAPLPCAPGNYNVSGGDIVMHLDGKGALLDATYASESLAPGSLTVASDGSVFLTGERLSKIRFGDPGSIAPPCMTLTILNSANLFSAYVVPGEFVSLAGVGIGPEDGVSAQIGAEGIPRALGGVRVLFDGTPAPVVYAQSRQVNVQAPFELSGQSKTDVTLEYNGATFGPFTVPIRFGDPGLFRLRPNVSAQVLAANEDGTLNASSNPANRGSIVTLWGNGFGPTSPGCATGGLNAPDAVNLAPGISVMILGGGPVQSAGGAPELACGVVQIKMQVPLDAPPGALLLHPQSVMKQPDGTTSFVRSSGDGPVIYIQ